jgi:hypothetical protein
MKNHVLDFGKGVLATHSKLLPRRKFTIHTHFEQLHAT